MNEVAFIVVKGSNFYNAYFKAKAEKQKFHTLAREFFKKNDLPLPLFPITIAFEF